MKKKRIVIALGHDALGTTLPEQQAAAKKTAKAIADFVKEDYQIIISHSNGPQVGMIHTAMSEFCKIYPEYTATPMSVCSAMSQGYIGYDLQNAIRTELLNRGIYKPVATVLTQMTVDPYDDAFYHPTKIIGRIMSAEEAEAEEKKGNHVVEVEGGYRRIVAAPKPMEIVEIDTIRALADADQVVIACGGGGIPVLAQENRLKGASAVIEKDLAARYYCPEISQIYSIEEKMGSFYFDVSIDGFKKTFGVKDISRNVKMLDSGSVMFNDSDGNRFIIPDINALKPRMRRKIELFLY